LTPPIDIRPGDLRIVWDVLRRHLPVDVRVWVFGSRASWMTKDSSDLDLAVEGDSEIGRGTLSALEAEFEDSDLPYAVDVVDLKRINERFRRIVQQQHVPLPVYRSSHSTDRPSGGAEACPNWRELPFTEAFLVNPPTRIERGTTRPFVDMATVNPSFRSVLASEAREFRGGGSRFRDGDTLMARITPCLENGKIARYCADGTSEPAHGSTEFIVVRGRPDTTNTDFAFYVTKSHIVRDYAIGQMTGTSGRQRVPTEALAHLTIAVPPLSEQRAIADILGTLDDKIELNRRMNATLESIARALFRSWFVDFDPVRAKMAGRDTGLPKEIADLFPDRLVESELGEIPEGWTVSELGDMIELAYGKALKAESRNAAGGVPVFGSNGQIGWHDEALVQRPGIVVGRKGNPGTVTLSSAGFFPIDTTFYVLPKHERHECLYFLFFALQAQDLPSVAADSAVPGLNRNLAYMNKQLRPPTSVVACFDGYVGAMYVRRREASAESRLLVSLRDSLLPRLVSGELRVSGLKPASGRDDRPAPVASHGA